ncbi:hypothetical protein [Stutzerimonas degradans]|uniref:hypothetical protein n=1 Tax=Stutzerimonas degradans TaxID=2968968 RepID=UPI0011AFCB0F|nr:hypothetical protein [Stutzerimonas degradans]MCQ4277081.1 hypothetical protein [Stutzerimonas degradans]QPT22208.1 hypothetical protein I6G33_02660 [Stutzerimonas degradans]
MIYVVAVTSLHRELGKLVAARSNNAVLIDVRRAGDLPGVKFAVKLYLLGIVALFRVLLDRRSHVVVAHPFNPWCALFIRFAQTVSVLDDGIAYYNNTATPVSWRARLYFFISGPVFRREGRKLGVIGYYDMLKEASIYSYYCICPEFFPPDNGLTNIVQLRLPKTTARAASRNTFVFLDSTSEAVRGYDCESVFGYLASRFSAGNDDFYFKPHPAGSGAISKKLEGCAWAKRISGSFEEFSEKHELVGLYSFFSSASMYVKMRSDGVKIYCFDNGAPEFNCVRKLMSLLGAHVIDV